MSNEMHMQRATTLVLAMMRSASTERIDPKKWWERAASSLETGAAVGSCFGEMIHVMAGKLQIDVTTMATAETIATLAEALADPGDFEAFRSLCERQSVFIVAMAQAHREEQRQEAGQQAIWGGAA